MNYDELNEFLKKYRSFNSSENKKNNTAEEKDNTQNKENNNYNYGFFYTNKNGFGCNDMPGGFQRINPALFVVIGDIVGDVMSGNLPFNVQNAVGNWIQLVGQAIETYSSQQTYFQSGPGRFYSPENLNITNPLCPQASSQATANTGTTNENEESSGNDTNTCNEETIKELCSIMNDMKNELDELKTRIEYIEEKEK